MNGKHDLLVALTSSLLLLGALTSRAVEPAKFAGMIRVPSMTAPAMEGRWIGAAEWQAAGQVTGWADSILGVANNDGTQVAVGHAAGVLCVRFTCPIPEKYRRNTMQYASSPLKTTVTQKDGDIVQDDYVGLYLTPPGSQDLYFLGVNGAGITRDSRNGDVSWNGQWQTQQSRDEFIWTVGFSIPLSQLGSAVTEDQAWGVNFAHGARQIELLESRWAYQPAKLEPMAEMRLSPRAIAVALAGFGNLAEGSLALKGQVGNLSQELFDGTLEVTVQDFSGVGKTVFGPEKTALALKPGEKKDIATNFDAGGSLCGKTLVTVKDVQGAVWLDYGLPFVFAREISLETRWIPTPSILQVVLDLGSPASFKKVTGGQVRITSAETQKDVLTQVLPAFQSSLSISDIDCGKLPVGRYEAEVELKLGSATTVFKDVFVKEANSEWLGNTIGISDKVPIPWTALKTDGGAGGWLRAAKPLIVSCWGRQYTFGPAGFPSQINVLDQDILAGPARILVKRGGKTEALPAGACQVTEKKDTRVTFKSVVRADGLEIAAETWIEFDGFVWTTFKVQSDAPVELEGLSIEIPLKKEFATLWWYPALSDGMLNDRMGAPPKQPYASQPLNYLRLGDEEHGVQFFYESLKNWNPLPGKGQELIPGDQEFVLRYNLIGQTTKLEKPAEFALGYIALPCRPRSKLFRRIDGPGFWTGYNERFMYTKEQLKEKNRLFQISPFFTSGWQGRNDSNYFNFWNEEVYPNALPQRAPTFITEWNTNRNTFCPEFLQKARQYWADQWEKNRNTFCLYYQAGCNDANTPEYRKYRFEWKITPGGAPYVPPDPKTMNLSLLTGVCHQSRSYLDFQIWCMDKMLRYLSDNGRIPVQGYQDCNGDYLCMNTLHGCPADGHIPILADREFSKRVYAIFKTLNPENQVYIHSKSSNAMYNYGFCDVMHEGEQYLSYSADLVLDPSLPKNYTKIFNLARYRAQSQPFLWGPEHFVGVQFFWQWLRDEPDGWRGGRGHIWGLALCHDTPVGWDAGPMCVSRAIGELGWDEKVEFIPYWRKQTGLEVKAPVSSVVTSGWKRGEGNLLVIVYNDGDQAADSQLTIDFARFGFKPGEIKCRNYGGAGLGYPDAIFNYNFTFQGVAATSIPVDPKLLVVHDTVITPGADLPVEVKQRSFKLLRFWQE